MIRVTLYIESTDGSVGLHDLVLGLHLLLRLHVSVLLDDRSRELDRRLDFLDNFLLFLDLHLTLHLSLFLLRLVESGNLSHILVLGMRCLICVISSLDVEQNDTESGEDCNRNDGF